jgi:hypothetical protein
MAYSDYGAFVRCNGDRRHDKEDVPVFGDADVEAAPSGARIFVHILKRRAEGDHERKPWDGIFHAVLGDGPVRLCGYKYYPVIFAVDDNGPRKIEVDPEDDDDEYWQDGSEASGETDGHKWRVEMGERITSLWMQCPDGTQWTATLGYLHGAGHDD